MNNLSVKERKLLYYLSKDSRESHTKIAKQIGVNKGTVREMIKRFQKEGIIRKFTSLINTSSLNATSFTLLLKFNKDIQKSKEIIEYFINHPFSIWVVTLSGNYDLLVEFIVKDLKLLDKMILEIREDLKEDINHYDFDLFSKNLRASSLLGDIYKSLELEKIPIKKRDFKEKNIDILDRKILRVLSNNSEKPLVEIAEEVGSTWDVVRYRMKLLEQAKIILGYFPEINYNKLNYLQFICKFELRRINKKTFEDFENLMKTNKNIIYAFSSVNSFSIIFHCAFKSIDELDNLLRSTQEKFKRNIYETNYFIIRDQLKLDFFPDGLLKD